MILKSSFLLLVGLMFLVSDTWADTQQNLDWSARTRYAEYDGDDFARAASLLLRADWKAEWTDNFSSDVQLDNVSRTFKNQHSDGVDLNGKPVIADAEGFDVNQAFFQYQWDSTQLRLGRQRINFDDQRFVGGNAFWQNEQTFDAFLVKANGLSNSKITYAYVDQVNRIFGVDAGKYLQSTDLNYLGPDSERPAGLRGVHKMNTHLLQINLNEWDYSQWIFYVYDMQNKTMPSSSNQTVGGNYQLTYKSDFLLYRLRIEMAQQKQTEAVNKDWIPYYNLQASVGLNHWSLDTQYEILSEKKSNAFTTPLGSNHDFNGLANESTRYTAKGLRDASLGSSWRSSPYKFEFRYHQFFNDTQNKYFAQETDWVFGFKPTKKHNVSFLIADYHPDGSAKATRKFYLDYSYNF